MHPQATLAVLVPMSFVALIACWMFFPPQGAPEVLAVLNTLMGALGAATTAIIGFYFGSSKGSEAKSDTLNKMAEAQAGVVSPKNNGETQT